MKLIGLSCKYVLEQLQKLSPYGFNMKCSVTVLSWDTQILQTNTFSFSACELVSGIIHGHNHVRAHRSFFNMTFYAEMNLVLLKNRLT